MGHTYSARISYFEVDLFIVFYIFIRVDFYGLFQNLKKSYITEGCQVCKSLFICVFMLPFDVKIIFPSNANVWKDSGPLCIGLLCV